MSRETKVRVPAGCLKTPEPGRGVVRGKFRNVDLNQIAKPIKFQAKS